MTKTTRKGRPAKPAKPREDFPLFPHATGRWAKKVLGKLHYFGPWADPGAALDKWLDQKDDLLAGRTPRVNGDGLTVRDLLNRFLTAKQHVRETGELSPRTFFDYHRACSHIKDAFGLTRLVADLASDDFEAFRRSLAKTRGHVALGNEITRIRVVFKYAFDAGLIPHPVRFGPGFKRPSKKTLRRERQAKGKRMIEPEDIRRLVDVAGPQMKAMILLGINAGLGNTDVAQLPLSALDLNGGWLDFPRPKTAIPRRVPLWPETVKALRTAIKDRPEPKATADRDAVFLTRCGARWVRCRDNGTWVDSVALEFGKLLVDAGIKVRATISTKPQSTSKPNGKAPRKQKAKREPKGLGLGFYALRHTFQTVAGDTKDQVAVDAIMGHADASMAAAYREEISDSRLRAVTEHVRQAVFQKAVPAAPIRLAIAAGTG